MRYHGKNTLCLEYEELVPDFMTKSNYDISKYRARITVFGNGGNGREVLIDFETLPEKIKDAVVKKYGDPYQYIVKQPLRDWAKFNKNETAYEYYNSIYVLPNGFKLPESYRDKYTKAITYLDAIQHYTTDKIALKRDFNVSMDAFWRMVADVLTAEGIDLPKRRERLTKVLNEYKKAGFNTPAGFELRIEKHRFGNENSKKVKDEVSEALLLEMIAHPHKHDDTVIAANYNKWAELNQRATITPAAVGYWRREKQHLITLTRDGAAVNYNKFSKRNMRDRPSAPLLLINSDDNILDLFFKDGKSDFYRPAGYFIIDGYNDYILGYAIGKTVTIDLIKAAYLNAIRHVMELTGECYLWHQIQTDRWSIDPAKKGELATFFSNQSHFTPATAKVSQPKLIERSFGITWHQQLKFFANYSGFNITAKERMNPDAIELARKNYPDKQFVPAQIAQFVEQMRQTVNPKTGLPRQKEWLAAVKQGVHQSVKVINSEKRLQLFGVKHNYTNKITAEGIRIEINHRKLFFEVPKEMYLKTIHKSVQVTYDPYDLSEVLVSDGKGLRFMAKEYVKMPSALADHTSETRKRLHEAQEFKKEIMVEISEAINKRQEILQRENIDGQSILQAGVLKKAINHKAQKIVTGYTEPEPEVIHDEPAFNWKQAI